MTPRLTITPGLRFQHYTAGRDAQGQWYNFDLQHLLDGGTGRFVVPQQSLHRVVAGFPANIPVVGNGDADFPGDLFEYKLIHVQPRVGVAFRLTDKMVIRAGFGVYTVPLTPPDNMQQAISGFTGGPFELSENFGPNEIINGVPTLTFSKAFPAPGTGATSLQSPRAILLDTRTKHWPTDKQWNLTLERELGEGFTGRVSYVASKGTHWPLQRQRADSPGQHHSVHGLPQGIRGGTLRFNHRLPPGRKLQLSRGGSRVAAAVLQRPLRQELDRVSIHPQ